MKVTNEGEIQKSVFDELSVVDCAEYLEKKKSGSTELTYLSWADCWRELMKRYPDSSYEFAKWKWADGTEHLYMLDDAGAFVMTRVTIEGKTREMMLPVMDGANKAMKILPYNYRVKNPNYRYAKPNADGVMVDKNGTPQEEYITKQVQAMSAMDVNKTLMRCLVKNIGMFGLGLYVYTGEDLPDSDGNEVEEYATRLIKARNELSRLGVDIRSDDFTSFVRQKANAHNIDPDALVKFPAELKRTVIVMEHIVEKKTNTGQ